MSDASEPEKSTRLPGCRTLDRPDHGAAVVIAKKVYEIVDGAVTAMEALGVAVNGGAMVASVAHVACRYCHERGAQHVVRVMQVDTPVGRFFAQTAENIQHFGARPPDPLPAPGTPPRGGMKW